MRFSSDSGIVSSGVDQVEGGEIDGQINRIKTTEGVCLNAGKSEQMAFQTRADLQNQAIKS
jgi:hypothetical protein